MRRTTWIFAATLAVTACLGCKDSSRNYIAFDAAVDVTTATDAARPEAPGDAAQDHTPDASVVDVAHDTTADIVVAVDVAVDGNLADADATETGALDGPSNDAEPGQ